MAQKANGSDRRRSPRIPAHSAGVVILVKGLRGTRSIACRILNTSRGGALIRVERAADLPDDFYLVMDREPSRKIVCCVARRAQRVLGVRFVPQPTGDVRIIRVLAS